MGLCSALHPECAGPDDDPPFWIDLIFFEQSAISGKIRSIINNRPPEETLWNVKNHAI
jgi:hypothetical protein